MSDDRQAAIVDALRAEPAPVDDVTRARWLARMSPELDAIAERHRRRAGGGGVRRWALPALAFTAACAVVLGVWLFGRDQHALTVAQDLERVRPYVVAGGYDESAAQSLLAGRFSTLDVGAGHLVRASLDGPRDRRLAVVGPARVSVTAASPSHIDLAMTGTLLVDERDGSGDLAIRAGTLVIHSQQATFAVSSTTAGTVVFVERGELELAGTPVRAGQWFGPEQARSTALISMLRDHVNAIAPPSGRSGIVAVEGTSPVFTPEGAVIGTAPLWVRLSATHDALVLAGSPEQRVAIAVGETTARVAPPAPPPVVSVAPTSIAPPVAKPAPRVKKAPSASTPRVEAPASVTDPVAELYARAEAALRAGDRVEAEAHWRTLVETYPTSAKAPYALYDLAQLLRTTAPRRAQTYLAQLETSSPPAALREPAGYLACRLDVAANELAAAATCFDAFRGRFPDSPHDAEVLAWLAGRAEATGGCTAARALSAEYLRRYPTGAFAARARACEATP